MNTSVAATAAAIFWWMLVAHALCDFPLQGDYMARAKNHLTPVPGTPWPLVLFWHGLIHGGAVAFLTRSIVLGIAETLSHIVIDYFKSDGQTTFWQDQYLHVMCKLLYAVVLIR